VSLFTSTPTERVSDLALVAPINLQPGSFFEGYRVEQILGRGGMGVVYSAVDLETNAPVAIKVLGCSILEPTLVSRFCRESRSVVRLNHPGIIKLHKVGQNKEVCYLVMELIEGVSLREWINQVPLRNLADSNAASMQANSKKMVNVPTFQYRADQLLMEDVSLVPRVSPLQTNSNVITQPSYHEEVVSILLQLLEAMEHAHSLGVVHRDLKPENVMIRPDGHVVIIDFGLARSYADTTMTTHSSLIGTPLYMAPEQIRGNDARPSSDLYTIGLMGYELLSLITPFRANSIEAILNNVLFHTLPPLTLRNPSVPKPLANIIHRAMAKAESGRYASARDFREDLERFRSGAVVQASKYKHRFDCAEIHTLRPRRILVATYSMLVLSGFFFLMAPLLFLSKWTNGVFMGAIAIWYLICAINLQSGKRHARTLGILNVGTSWFFFGQLSMHLSSANPELFRILIIFMIAFATIGLLTMGTILSRKTRHWLAQIREKRRVFESQT
jgi:eukaryotic-like serine/threonine-protein kinase